MYFNYFIVHCTQFHTQFHHKSYQNKSLKTKNDIVNKQQQNDSFILKYLYVTCYHANNNLLKMVNPITIIVIIVNLDEQAMMA